MLQLQGGGNQAQSDNNRSDFNGNDNMPRQHFQRDRDGTDDGRSSHSQGSVLTQHGHKSRNIPSIQGAGNGGLRGRDREYDNSPDQMQYSHPNQTSVRIDVYISSYNVACIHACTLYELYLMKQATFIQMTAPLFIEITQLELSLLKS